MFSVFYCAEKWRFFIALQSGSLYFEWEKAISGWEWFLHNPLRMKIGQYSVFNVQSDSSFFCFFVFSAKHRRKINWIYSVWSIRRLIQFIVLSIKKNNELTWYSIYAGNTLVEIFIICQLITSISLYILYHRHYIYFIEDYYVLIKIFNHGWPSQKTNPPTNRLFKIFIEVEALN